MEDNVGKHTCDIFHKHGLWPWSYQGQRNDGSQQGEVDFWLGGQVSGGVLLLDHQGHCVGQ